MKIGILSFRNNRYHPNRRLIEASEKQGHKAVLMHPARYFLSAEDRLDLAGIGNRPLPDVVLPRIGSTIREFPLSLIHHLELIGVTVVNGFDAVSLTRNKFRTLQALTQHKIPIPFSVYVSNPKNLEAAARMMKAHPFVVKTPHGRQGRGVFLVNGYEEARGILEAEVETGQGLVLQEYIPVKRRLKELRVFIIGGKTVGAMSLKPRPGEFRANIHMHGRAERVRLPKAANDMAIEATKVLGLDISGIDMIQASDKSFKVLDVNYSPGFKGLERCTGKDIAAKIIQYAVSRRGRAE
jgi:ribosomal protein S6--L-glutamate ligase